MTTLRCAPVETRATVPSSAHPRLLELLQALAEEKRLRILETLGAGEACVCELQEALGMTQSLLSHHLRVLREAGLVEDRRDGRWIYYSLMREALREAEEGLASLRSALAAPREPGTACCEPSSQDGGSIRR
jgi:ArsR family transcriptional regulator